MLETVFRASEEENRRAILKIAERYGPAEKMVDLGCFDGAFTMRVAEAVRARIVSGVEFIQSHGEKAAARGVDVVNADLSEPLPFPNDEFDLVHANQVIEHVRSTDLFLSEASRVARPGGLVIISTNNLASWHNIASLIFGFQPMPSHVSDVTHVGNPLSFREHHSHNDEGQTHLRIFTRRALAELASFHGLRPITLAASGFYPFPPALARLVARIDKTHAAFIIGAFRASGTEHGLTTTAAAK